MANTSGVFQQEDEKKNKKKQSPVDERPPVPAPSEAMLNSECSITPHYKPTKCLNNYIALPTFTNSFLQLLL